MNIAKYFFLAISIMAHVSVGCINFVASGMNNPDFNYTMMSIVSAAGMIAGIIGLLLFKYGKTAAGPA